MLVDYGLSFVQNSLDYIVIAVIFCPKNIKAFFGFDGDSNGGAFQWLLVVSYHVYILNIYFIYIYYHVNSKKSIDYFGQNFNTYWYLFWNLELLSSGLCRIIFCKI